MLINEAGMIYTVVGVSCECIKTLHAIWLFQASHEMPLMLLKSIFIICWYNYCYCIDLETNHDACCIGAMAVVEGVGDHCCEYMTGGIAVILGSTGKNFGAGMSGGIAYVYNPDGQFKFLCNSNVENDLEPVEDTEDVNQLRSLIQRHMKYTGSEKAKFILANWDQEVSKFTKV